MCQFSGRSKYQTLEVEGLTMFVIANWKLIFFQGHTSQNCNPNTESKRPSKPVNITQLCRLSPTVPNHIHVSWTPKFGQVSLIIYLMELDIPQIITKGSAQSSFLFKNVSEVLGMLAAKISWGVFWRISSVGTQWCILIDLRFPPIKFLKYYNANWTPQYDVWTLYIWAVPELFLLLLRINMNRSNMWRKELKK